MTPTRSFAHGLSPAAGWVAPAASRPLPRTVRRPFLGTDLLRVSLILLMVVAISRVHQHFELIARLRPAFVLTACATLWAILDPRALDLRGLLRHWPAKVMLSLGIFTSVAAVFGISAGRSAQYLPSYWKVLIFAFFVIAVLKTTRDLRLFVWAYVGSAAVLVWMALWVFNVREAGLVERLDKMYTYDSNDVGCVLVAGLPLVLLTFQTAARWGKLCSAAVLVGIGAAIARTGSRGAFVGLVAVALTLVLLLVRVPFLKRIGLVAPVVIALALGAPPGYWDQIDTLKHPKTDYNWRSEEGRLQVWTRGIGYMLRYPLSGVGINNFGRAEGTLSDKGKSYSFGRGVRWTAPHNSFVQAGAELGVPGLLLWSSLVVGGVAGPLRLRRRLPAAWLHGDAEERFLYQATLYLPVAMVGFAATAFFVSLAYMDPIYLLAAFVAGLYSSAERRLRSGPVG